MNRQLVIGLGQIGTAIRAILECDGCDQDASRDVRTHDAYDVLHVCFPYGPSFEDEVRRYAGLFGAPGSLLVIHSTVPVGTSDRLGAVHSPIRGVHPHLEKGIRTFVKFFGGARAEEAAALFKEKGVETLVTPNAKDTEAMKLWDTTIYSWNILIEKAIKEHCDTHGLDFDVVYTRANETYNSGYAALGMPQFAKYVLKHYPGPIGGHCLLSNWELLDHPIIDVANPCMRA